MDRFISCDWGTSRLRLRLVERATQRVLSEHISNDGIQTLASLGPAGESRRARLGAALEGGIATLGTDCLPGLPIVMSGMASSTLGWQDLPYARLPASVDGGTLHVSDFIHHGRKVRLVSGLRGERDVMRGEETELIGLFSDPVRRPLADDCVAILPGSHSKHVRMTGGQIVDFTTFLTGELFGLLAQSSTLAGPVATEFDDEAFLAGVRTCQSLGLSAALFQTRACVVLGRIAARHSRTFLSGTLIGAELSALQRYLGVPLVLAAGGEVSRQYLLALKELLPAAGVTAIPPDELAAAVVRGHSQLLSRP
ncbi:MAG: 2-dehydro-3-deoxygalactonokinase [Opitutaceae bacterium]|nr:2-dehydro-3-deoxygalactonokinase [Opitutaceae bacterium]